MTHYAAGILPVSWHDGQVVFLVGQDARDRTWSDFGGKCERADKNDPLNTATREFYEETHGCVLDVTDLRQRLGPTNCLALKGRTKNNHVYWMFVVEIPYTPHLRNAFLKSLAFLKHLNLHRTHVEKVDVQWVTWPRLRNRVHKRPVFAATLQAHDLVLGRVAAGEPWNELCAELAGAHHPG